MKKESQQEKLISLPNTIPPISFDRTKISEYFFKIKNKEMKSVLFDSNEDNWNKNDSSFSEKLLNKSTLLILIDNEYEMFGCFIPSQINQIGKFIESDKCFIYSLNYQQTYPIKQKNYSICIHNPNDDKLLTD